MKKIKIYLDNCCFNRPFDDQEQIKIRLESDAKLEIQSRIKNKKINLSWSFMLDFENNQNIDLAKKYKIFVWQKYAVEYFMGSDKTQTIAESLCEFGIGKKDAVHLACAIECRCDYFITTDEVILKKRNLIDSIKIINPVDFFSETGE